MTEIAISSYIYTSLNNNVSTRVLELEPSALGAETLRCRLVDYDLNCNRLELADNGDLSYEAISYAWGSSELTEDLIVDDSLLKITSSLATALRRFRWESRVRRLWADAVCINQRDAVEKSKQIPLMPRIYREASRVLVWLGSQRDHESVQSSMRRLSSSLRGLDSFRPRPNSKEFKPKLSAEHGNFASIIRRSLENLLQLPWFTRRWVIQEVALNPEVDLFCDDQKISWRTLMLVMREFKDINHHLGWRSSKELDSLGSMTELWNSIVFHRRGLEVERLLQDFDHFNCADDKDRIFAIVGLAAGDIDFDTDYTKTTEEIYNELAGALVRSRNNIEVIEWLLHQAEARRTEKSKSDGLRSWSPDWRIPPTFIPVIQRRSAAKAATMERDIEASPTALRCPEGDSPWGPGFKFLKSRFVNVKIDSKIDPLFANEQNVPRWLKNVYDQCYEKQSSRQLALNVAMAVTAVIARVVHTVAKSMWHSHHHSSGHWFGETSFTHSIDEA